MEWQSHHFCCLHFSPLPSSSSHPTPSLSAHLLSLWLGNWKMSQKCDTMHTRGDAAALAESGGNVAPLPCEESQNNHGWFVLASFSFSPATQIITASPAALASLWHCQPPSSQQRQPMSFSVRLCPWWITLLDGPTYQGEITIGFWKQMLDTLSS